MFPAIFVVFMIYVGLVASFDRNFHRLKLFIGENVDILKQSKSKGDENSKSLVERFEINTKLCRVTSSNCDMVFV